jgi:hypothetical protein
MSQVRHDVAYVELVDGEHFVLIVFTAGHSDDREIIPAVARTVVEGMISAQ